MATRGQGLDHWARTPNAPKKRTRPPKRKNPRTMKAAPMLQSVGIAPAPVPHDAAEDGAAVTA